MAVTELRIHGVSGTPPEQILDSATITRVAGDAETGFYRPRSNVDSEDLAGVQREAYSWGYLTAGAAARALWLLLAPFALANVATWMRPAAWFPGDNQKLRRADRLTVGICRLFSLTLTLTLVLASVGVGMDLVGWQCASTSCVADRWYLTPYTWSVVDTPGRRLVLGALVPLAVLGLLWYLGRRTWARYESYRADDDDAPGFHTGLANPAFWRGRLLVGRLRSLHVGAGLATISIMLVLPALEFDQQFDQHRRHWLAFVGWVLLGLALAIIAGAMCAIWTPAVASPDDPAPWAAKTFRWLRDFALLVLAGAATYVVLPRAHWQAAGPLPSYAPIVTGLFLAQVVLLLAMVLAVLPLRRATARQQDRTLEITRAAFAGFATPVFSTLALLTGAAFSAGVTFRVADWLDGGAIPSPASGDEVVLQPPAPFAWAAFGFPFAVILAVGVAIAAWVWVLPQLIRRAKPITDSDFPGLRNDDPDGACRIDRAIGEASITDHASRLITLLLLPCVLLALVLVVIAVVVDVGPVGLAPAGSTVATAFSVITNVGTWLIGAVAIGLVILGVQAYRTASLRRMVGILWDLVTFWPRAAHPLAPPCYAERAVPELALRTRWLAVQGGVILSGHSQGSVLAAATVLQLPRSTRQRVALLTHGSPLRRLYARYFPAFLGPQCLQAIAERMQSNNGQPEQAQPIRWRNLWRATDPIGGFIGSSKVDQRLVDPASAATSPGDTVPPSVRGHSGYDRDTAYRVVVAQLRDVILHSSR